MYFINKFLLGSYDFFSLLDLSYMIDHFEQPVAYLQSRINIKPNKSRRSESVGESIESSPPKRNPTLKKQESPQMPVPALSPTT